MNYKYIILNTLLITFSLCGANETLAQIHQLEDELMQKELQLSELGEEIEQQEELLISMFDKMVDAMGRVQHSLKNEEEKKEFSETIIDFENRFDQAVLNRNAKDFFVNELFNMPMNNKLMTRRIKSILIRYNMELRLLRRLIKKYDAALKELIELDSNK
ncbi:MAG: hypothetical protein BWY54_00204 [Candidatus Dependentiae bacterium ADurb.Bin331]|nr:MAG: hypothetical protein BWY54_00204 [Candidatus Dependentiae bacterium ADurb.Bin331]